MRAPLRSRIQEEAINASAILEVADMLFSMTKQEGIKEELNLDLEMWAEATRNQRVYDILHKNEESAITQMVEMVKRGQKEGIFDPALNAISIARLLFSVFVGFEVQMVSNPDMDIDSYQAVSNALIEGTLVKKSKK